VITLEELLLIMPNAKPHAADDLGPLNDSMLRFDISTPLRIAAYLAQIAEETEELQWLREIASGVAYEGRKDLGNVEPGDGVRYKGRGAFQVTGADNYQKCSIAIFGDERLLDQPTLLEEPEFAFWAAGWFWNVHKLNQLADQQDMRGITRVINGGYNGLDRRLAYYKRALDVFGRWV
jgi:putative chitinase